MLRPPNASIPLSPTPAIGLPVRRRLGALTLWAMLSGALYGGCCSTPPCGSPHAPPCPTTDGGAVACPSVADIAGGAAIPGAEASGVGHWICALDADILGATSSSTFVEEQGYRAQWAKRVEHGWLALTAHIQAQSSAWPEVAKLAVSLGGTLKQTTADADMRKKLVDLTLWRDEAQMLFDKAKAVPGLAPPCDRP